MFGNRHDPFIYQIAWDGSIRRETCAADFDNRLHLLDGAGDHLGALGGTERTLSVAGHLPAAAGDAALGGRQGFGTWTGGSSRCSGCGAAASGWRTRSSG